MAEEFRNWSGSMTFRPRELVRPRDEDEVVALVGDAREQGRTVRPVGSGHSSTPLVATDDILVSLEHLTGLVDHDTDRLRARVRPGTGLAELGGLLDEVGLGMENLGDVDYQAIAGAIGTGTHGTGETLGNLSSTLVGGTLVTGTADLVRFGEQDDGSAALPGLDSDDLTRAAQVSLGALGILTSLTLRLVPAYHLHRRNWMTHIDWVLEHFDELAASNRHVDFYWYPRSDLAQVRTLNEPGLEPGLVPPGRLKTEESGPSYEIITNRRENRFEEMEYMLPREVGLEVFRQVRDRVRERHRRIVAWRVLVRTIAPDQAMLSNARGRDTMTIALLQNASLPYEEYFADLEPVFLAHGGRPHWGKKHSRRAEHLREMYDEWPAFARIRRVLDPDGVFGNDYLRDLLGEPED